MVKIEFGEGEGCGTDMDMVQQDLNQEFEKEIFGKYYFLSKGAST